MIRDMIHYCDIIVALDTGVRDGNAFSVVFGGHAYDGLFIAVDAIKRAGGSDKAKVRDQIEKTKGFIGTAGVFNMSPDDHMGLNLDAFKMVEIRNGGWKLIE